MDVNTALEMLYKKAMSDENLKASLIATQEEKEPVESFCKLASEAGCPLDMGEFFSYNEQMLSNMLKSTNGGATYPIEEWGDCYEQFIASLM